MSPLVPSYHQVQQYPFLNVLDPMGWPNKRLRTSYANSAAAAEPSRRSWVAVPSLRHAEAASGGRRAASEIDDCATACRGKGGADAPPLPSASCHIDRLPVGFPAPRPHASPAFPSQHTFSPPPSVSPNLPASSSYAHFKSIPFMLSLSVRFTLIPHPSDASTLPPSRFPLPVPLPIPAFTCRSFPIPARFLSSHLSSFSPDELVATILRAVFKKAQSLSDIASLLLTDTLYELFGGEKPAGWSIEEDEEEEDEEEDAEEGEEESGDEEECEGPEEDGKQRGAQEDFSAHLTQILLSSLLTYTHNHTHCPLSLQLAFPLPSPPHRIHSFLASWHAIRPLIAGRRCCGSPACGRPETRVGEFRTSVSTQVFSPPVPPHIPALPPPLLFPFPAPSLPPPLLPLPLNPPPTPPPLLSSSASSSPPPPNPPASAHLPAQASTGAYLACHWPSGLIIERLEELNPRPPLPLALPPSSPPPGLNRGIFGMPSAKRAYLHAIIERLEELNPRPPFPPLIPPLLFPFKQHRSHRGGHFSPSYLPPTSSSPAIRSQASQWRLLPASGSTIAILGSKRTPSFCLYHRRVAAALQHHRHPRITGEWRLLYSTIAILGSKRTKLGLRDFISLGDFIQIVDKDTRRAANAVEFSVRGLGLLSGKLTIEATYTVSSPTRVDIRFESSSIVPDQLNKLFEKNYDLLLRIFNPDGWLEIT
ncbi:unnamed protein product, partial [Closterium sp. Naga37s-1]